MKVIVEQFVLSLSESGLMTREEIDAFLNRFPAGQRPQTAEAFARALVENATLTKYQAQAIYHGNTKGLILGNYVVLDKIGQGGMGQVYKAMHRRMKRIVVLKVVLPTSATSKEAMQRFQREVEALAKLSHPNIVTAHDADEAGGVCFLVMEYVEGQDLAKLVRRDGPLPVKKALDYVVQAAKGLEYAHRQEVIHRDIKPGNLVLDVHGTVKILDLGLAKLQQDVGIDVRSASASLTQTGQVVGTIDYLSPEQSLDSRRVDGRSDIYSLGCTLFFLLLGRPIFGGDTVARKILAHREDAVPSLCLLRRDIPEELDRAFRRMVAKRPEYRFQSMGEVIAELEACGESLAPATPEAETMTYVGPERGTVGAQDDSTSFLYWTGRATSLVRTIGSTRWQAWLVVANVVVLLSIIVLLFVFSTGSSDSPEVSQGPVPTTPLAAEPAETTPPPATGTEPVAAAPAEPATPTQPLATPTPPPPQAATPEPRPAETPGMTVQPAAGASVGPGQASPALPLESTTDRGQQPGGVPTSAEPALPTQPPQPEPAPAAQMPDTAPAPKPVAEPTMPQDSQPSGPAPTSAELLAALEQFGLVVEFKSGDGEKIPKQLAPLLDEFKVVLRGTLEQMVAVRTVNLKLADDTSQAVMEVIVTPRQEQAAIVLHASAQLKSHTAQGWVELWYKPESELVKFMVVGKMSSTQLKQLRYAWGEKIRDYFQEFRTERMKQHKGQGV